MSFNDTLINPPSGCLQRKMLVCNESAKALSSSEKRDVIKSIVISRDVSKVQAVMAEYNAKMIASQFEYGMNKRSYYIYTAGASGISAALGCTVGGPIGAATASMLGTIVVDKAGQDIVDAINEESKNQINSDLAFKFEIIRRQDATKIDEMLLANGEDRGKAREEIMKNFLKDFNDKAFEDVEDDLRDTVQSVRIKFLGDLSTLQLQQLIDHGKKIAENEKDIKDLKERAMGVEKKTQALVNEYHNFVKDNNDTLDRLNKNIKTASDNLQKLEKKVKDNTEDIRKNAAATAENSKKIRQNEKRLNYIEGFIYGQMNPQEQLEALDNGFFNELPPEERKELRDTAELKKFIAQDIGKYAQGASAALALADSINGITGNRIPIPDEVRIGVAASSHLVELGLSLIPPANYIGAMNAVTQLVGLGSKQVDVGAARHEQVMQTLGQLLQGEQQIIDNQGVLLKNSEYLIKYMDQLSDTQIAMFNRLIKIEEAINVVLLSQEDILKKLVEMDRKIENHYRAMMEQFALLSHQISLGHFNMYYGFNKEVVNLYQEVEAIYQAPGFSKTKNCFSDYASLKSFFRGQTKRNLQAGLPTLRNVMYITPGGLTDSVFRLNSMEAEATWISNFLSVYRDFWDIIGDLTPSSDYAYFSGLFPAENISQLKKKLDLFKNPLEDLLPPRHFQLLKGGDAGIGNPTALQLLKEPYSFKIVNDLTIFTIRFHFIFDVCHEDTLELMPIDLITKATDSSKDGQSLLERAIIRLDLLIIQQTLRTGDCFLPTFFEIWREGPAHAKYEKLKSLFERDQLLARNFLMYALREEISKYDPHYFRYTVALKSKVDRDLKALTTLPWDFAFLPKEGWHVNFSGHVFSLPSAIHLQQGNLIQADEVVQTILLRKRVIDELACYHLSERFVDEKTRQIYMASLYAS